MSIIILTYMSTSVPKSVTHKVIRQYRTKKGLTRAALARELCVTENLIFRVELGNRRLGIHALAFAGRILDIPEHVLNHLADTGDEKILILTKNFTAPRQKSLLIPGFRD